MSFTQEITLRTIRQRLDYLKTKREQVVAESKKEPLSDRVSFFDSQIYFPERRKLREHCSMLGHALTVMEQPHSSEHYVCLACGISQRRSDHDLPK